MEIALLFFLILLNVIFALSEMALVSARKARLATLAAEGDKRAMAAIRLGEDPARFLSAIQIGITSIGLFSGIVGEAALAGPLGLWLQNTFALSPATAGTVSTVLVVTSVTYLSIVIGELVPKRLGQLAPEKTACLVARPMNALALLSRPFVALLSFSTSLMLRLLGVRNDAEQSVTEEEIQAMLRRLPEEDEGLYSILSGMLMYLSGRIPSEGDIMEYADWRFEIVDMDGNRIDKVLVSPSKQKKDA